jgi:hypothetical protein
VEPAHVLHLPLLWHGGLQEAAVAQHGRHLRRPAAAAAAVNYCPAFNFHVEQTRLQLSWQSSSSKLFAKCAYLQSILQQINRSSLGQCNSSFNKQACSCAVSLLCTLPACLVTLPQPLPHPRMKHNCTGQPQQPNTLTLCLSPSSPCVLDGRVTPQDPRHCCCCCCCCPHPLCLAPLLLLLHRSPP